MINWIIVVLRSSAELGYKTIKYCDFFWLITKMKSKFFIMIQNNFEGKNWKK